MRLSATGLLLLLAPLVGCRDPAPVPADDDDATPDDDDRTPGDDDSGDDDSGDDDSSDDDDSDDPFADRLEIRFFGVGGVSIRHGSDLILTAPFFTNPDLLTVTTGQTVSNPALIDALLPIEHVQGAAAILVGHGHYDHLLDAPYIRDLTPDARIYGNFSVKNLIGGLYPPGSDTVVALNEGLGSPVDRRMCPGDDPCTGVPAGNEGAWVPIEGANARLRPLCSTHPPQFLDTIHFGEGCVTSALASPPTVAGEWLEGSTLAYLIDLLNDDGSVAFRVYYQDAPADGPLGQVHPDLLAEKRVDVALLNVGTFLAVQDHPGSILAALNPRYALGLHWESFFETQEEPIVPIRFHAPPAEFDARVAVALPVDDEAPVLRAGELTEGRYWRPWPGTLFGFVREGSWTPPSFVVEASTEASGASIALRTNLPSAVADCLDLLDAPCEDRDGDGLVDAWEDLALDRLRPLVRFDESEPFIDDVTTVLHAVGRVAPVPGSDHERVFVMLGYSQDYGRCGVSVHGGDSERVVLDLAPLAGGAPGDHLVTGLYTAAHEGTLTDHGQVLTGDGLADAEFAPTDRGPRWVVYASDGKHATYPNIASCEAAEWAPCLDEDCGAEGVDDPAIYEVLPPFVNAGEPNLPRWTDLGPLGFARDDAWLAQDFCGGRRRTEPCSAPVRDKLLDDPFAP